MRVWYAGPWALNQSTRSVSRRSVSRCLGRAARTTWAFLKVAGLGLEGVRVVADRGGDLVVGQGVEPVPVGQALIKPRARTHPGKLAAHGAAIPDICAAGQNRRGAGAGSTALRGRANRSSGRRHRPAGCERLVRLRRWHPRSAPRPPNSAARRWMAATVTAARSAMFEMIAADRVGDIERTARSPADRGQVSAAESEGIGWRGGNNTALILIVGKIDC
jgi:hypothetical protein